MKYAASHDVVGIEYQSALYGEMVRLRQEVLRTPLGLVFKPEDLEKDKKDVLLGLLEDGKLLACLILTPSGNGVFKMRQVAVAPGSQGKGLGKILVKASEEKTLSLGGTRLEMHARQTAIPFYESLGYTAEGPVFEEVSIPHRFMFKNLQ